MSNDLKKIMLKLNKLDDIEQLINFVSEKFHVMEKEIKEVKTEVKSSVKMNKELQKEVSYLRNSVKLLQDEMVSRKCFLKNVNIPENHSPLSFVQDMVSTTGIPKENVVSVSVRTSRTQEQYAIVEFSRSEQRLKFLQSKRKLQEQPCFNKVIAYDVMGAETLTIYKYAAALKSTGYKFIYQRSGVIYAKRNEDDRKPAAIKTYADVDRLLGKETFERSSS